jgi:NAD(P)-dependent dehydrogenase (short-subunit alcohol dehydrogenase family)
LATELRETYRVDVIVEQVDLSNVAAVIQLHQRLRERGIAIDILINNAGHGLQGTFVDGTLDAALAMLQLDVVSLTAVTHVFAQDMRTRGAGRSCWSPACWPIRASRSSRSTRPPKRTSCVLVKRFIANSNATASR